MPEGLAHKNHLANTSSRLNSNLPSPHTIILHNGAGNQKAHEANDFEEQTTSSRPTQRQKGNRAEKSDFDKTECDQEETLRRSDGQDRKEFGGESGTFGAFAWREEG